MGPHTCNNHKGVYFRSQSQLYVFNCSEWAINSSEVNKMSVNIFTGMILSAVTNCYEPMIAVNTYQCRNTRVWIFLHVCSSLLSKSLCVSCYQFEALVVNFPPRWPGVMLSVVVGCAIFLHPPKVLNFSQVWMVGVISYLLWMVWFI